MSESEIKIEIHYRYAERIGLLCGDGMPLPVEKNIARAEAEDWLARIKKENGRPEVENV